MNFNTAFVLVIVGACLAFGAPPRFNYSSTHPLNYVKFSNKLIQTISEKTEGSFVVSPMSLAHTLIIALSGAEYETLRELDRVLHRSAERGEVLAATRKLIEDSKGEKDVTISLLNSFVVNENYKLPLDLIRMINWVFGSGTLSEKDFTDGGEVANGINKYVENGTHGTIKDLVTAAMFKTDTPLVAVNVLYFQSKWSGFKDLPQPQNFRLEDGSVVRTPMITAEGWYVFHETRYQQIIKIPFINEKFAMIIVMQKYGSPYLLWATPLPEIFSLMNNSEYSSLRVTLPKFVIESKHDLEEIVTSMGAGRMFGQQAEFPRFTKKGGLYVSSLIQKAYINVTSGGVEASAATAMVTGLRSAFDDPSRPVIFDRPFMAYITYESMPLFAMRVTDPRP